MQRNPGVTYKDLNPEQLSVFMAAFNASTPPSNFAATDVRLYSKPDTPDYYIMISAMGCVLQQGEAHNAAVHGWMAGKPLYAPIGGGGLPQGTQGHTI